MKSLLKLKLKNIYFKIIKLIFDKIYGKLEVSNISFFSNEIKITNISLNKLSKKKYKIYSIPNARIYNDLKENVAVIKEKKILNEASIQLEDNHLKDVSYNKILKTGTRKLIQKKIHGNVLSLVQGFSAIDNYGHWILDIIPKLFIIEKYSNFENFDAIYLPNVKKKFQIDSLKYFNINPKKYIDGSKFTHIYAENLTVPQHPYWQLNKYQMETVANIDPDVINYLKNKFLKINNNFQGKKLFIDRSDSKYFHSQIENIDELYKLFKSYDFEILKLTNFSFQEQISLFNNAKIIVGAHGAGLCNLIFCRSKTKVIEISNKEFKCDLFKNISKFNNLEYHKLVSISDVPKNRINPDIKVSIEDLSRLIK